MSGSIRTAYCTTFRSQWFEAHLMTAGVHRHPCIITINRENGTFIIHETDDPETDKGSGTLTFDSASGEYTMTYTAGGPETQDDPVSTFRYDNSLVFTSALKLGRSAMNVTDEDGRFIPYTAKPVNTAQDESSSNESSDVSAEDESKPPVTGAANTTAVLLITVATVLFVVSRKKES